MVISQLAWMGGCSCGLGLPVDEDVVESELKDEGLELLLNLEVGVFPFLLREDMEGVYRPAIHYEVWMEDDARG